MTTYCEKGNLLNLEYKFINAMLILNGEDLIEVLDAKTAVNAMREAFYKFYSRNLVQVPRQVLSIKGNWWGIMTSFQDKGFTIKIVNVINENKDRGLPSVQGLVLLMSVDTGEPLAIMNGTVLTAIRTSATSILSTEISLRNNSIDTLGVIGAGIEAYYHIILAKQYFKIGRILINARKSHFDLAKKVGGEAVSLEKLLRESQVIFSTTSSTTPVVIGSLLQQEDFHISSIGAHTPEARELDDDTIMKAKTIFADSLDAVRSESGDFILPEKKGLFKGKKVYEIGEIIAEGIKIERPSIFKTVGIPAQDNLAAITAYEEALKRGIGKQVEL